MVLLVMGYLVMGKHNLDDGEKLFHGSGEPSALDKCQVFQNASEGKFLKGGNAQPQLLSLFRTKKTEVTRIMLEDDLANFRNVLDEYIHLYSYLPFILFGKIF